MSFWTSPPSRHLPDFIECKPLGRPRDKRLRQQHVGPPIIGLRVKQAELGEWSVPIDMGQSLLVHLDQQIRLDDVRLRSANRVAEVTTRENARSEIADPNCVDPLEANQGAFPYSPPASFRHQAHPRVSGSHGPNLFVQGCYFLRGHEAVPPKNVCRGAC
jgi:hypothetical protein